MLAFRARASRELRLALLKKGEPEPYVDAALQRLSALGLLNDADYARQFSRSKVLGPGHSKRRLQQELFKKGVAREVADEAIADVLEDEAVDTDAIIERLARRKAQSLRGLDPTARNRRLWSFLARRGYDADDIRKAIEAITGDKVEPADGSEATDDEE
jgi:regulatory protein